VLCLWLATTVTSGCDGEDEEERSRGGTAARTAPQESGGIIETGLPIYAGDPGATRAPSGQETLAKLPRITPPAATGPLPNIRGSRGKTVAQWLSFLNNDIASFWQAQFNSRRVEYRLGRQAIFSADSVRSRCGSFSQDDGPFYCNTNGTIYLPLRWFRRLITPIGDAAISTIVAHENGHRVQDLLGILRDRSKRAIDLELQADCLAGYWAASLYARRLVEPGDYSEALRISRLSGDAPGTRVEMAHGSPRQRADAFRRGYNRGRAGDCRI
jgi:uncharacterized protein